MKQSMIDNIKCSSCGLSSCKKECPAETSMYVYKLFLEQLTEFTDEQLAHVHYETFEEARIRAGVQLK